MDPKRLISYAARRFSAEPEHLWKNYPDVFVLRHPCGKWFAVVMEVERAKLGLAGPGKVFLADVKCGPLLGGSFLGQPGVVPAYHMNKTHWLGLLLDGSAPDGTVKELLEISYELAGPKRGRRAARHDPE